MRLFLCAFVAALALTACGPELPETFDPSPVSIEEIPEPGVNAFLSGRLADSQNVYERGEYRVSYNNSYQARISFSTPTEGDRAVMAVLSLDGGGLDHPDLQIGNHFSVDRYEATENDLIPTIIGCEGPFVDNWSYDSTADNISVDVTEPRPGVRRISYLALWENYNTALPDILSGYFDIQE